MYSVCVHARVHMCACMHNPTFGSNNQFIECEPSSFQDSEVPWQGLLGCDAI